MEPGKKRESGHKYIYQYVFYGEMARKDFLEKYRISSFNALSFTSEDGEELQYQNIHHAS